MSDWDEEREQRIIDLEQEIEYYEKFLDILEGILNIQEEYTKEEMIEEIKEEIKDLKYIL